MLGLSPKGHAYTDKQGNITCPNKDKPGVKEVTKKAHTDFKECMKQQSSKKKWSTTAMMVTDALKNLSQNDTARPPHCGKSQILHPTWTLTCYFKES